MSAELTPTRARRIRLRAHLLAGSDLTSSQVIDRAVAFQGQDLRAVLRSIAIRSQPGTTVADVCEAFDRGELVRSWPMRGTLFATTPAHLATLLHFTGERIHRATTKRRMELGLDDDVIARARDVLTAALGESPLTRAQTLALWEESGISPAGGRGYHLILHFSVGGLVHWGPFTTDGKEQQLVLSAPAEVADPDAGLASIVRSYVAARGPVGLEDLAWWTKLPKTQLRRAAQAVADLVEVSVAANPAWVLAEHLEYETKASGVVLVPAFDEWILGYGERSPIASEQMQKALVPGNNGVFRPAILLDGTVVGTWKAPPGSKKAVGTVLEEISARAQVQVEKALQAWRH